MTPVQLGPTGWQNKIARLAAAAASTIMAAGLVALLTGCSAKKSAAPGAGNEKNNLGEAGTTAKGTSLAQLQKGTLGGPETGPLTDIHFDYNDFTVRAQDGEILRSDAAWLGQNPRSRVQVEGHCDERGSEDYNIALGARRAQAAKDYLVTLGVAGDRLSTISYGKELPLCTEHNESCWERNRRAHFVVSR